MISQLRRGMFNNKLGIPLFLRDCSEFHERDWHLAFDTTMRVKKHLRSGQNTRTRINQREIQGRD